MAKNNVRKTKQFKALRAEAQEAIIAYMDGLSIDETVKRLAPVGAKMMRFHLPSRIPRSRYPHKTLAEQPQPLPPQCMSCDSMS